MNSNQDCNLSPLTGLEVQNKIDRVDEELTLEELESITGGVAPLAAGAGLVALFGAVTIVATSFYESIKRGHFFVGFNSKVNDGINKSYGKWGGGFF